jgi:hypothetical protein
MTPTRKDIMYGFAVEETISEALLKEYQQRYPQYADDLHTLYVELLRDDTKEIEEKLK